MILVKHKTGHSLFSEGAVTFVVEVFSSFGQLGERGRESLSKSLLSCECRLNLCGHDLQVGRHIFSQRVKRYDFTMDGIGYGLRTSGVKLGLDKNYPGLARFGLRNKD